LKLQTLNKKQIQQLFQKGHSLSHGLFAIKYNKTEYPTRICISFSKKLKLNKPQKNRLKRQIRDILTKNSCKTTNLQFIIILLKTPSELENIYNQMTEDILEILSEVNNPYNEI